MRVDRLEIIRDRVLAEPEKLDMSSYHCGTSHCIAGWATWLFAEGDARLAESPEMAQELLGLTNDQADNLFYPPAWQLAGKFWEEITAPHAAKVIDHLISTGEVDWRVGL